MDVVYSGQDPYSRIYQLRLHGIIFRNKVTYVTPTQIYGIVLRDSFSQKQHLTISLTDLHQVCNDPQFPDVYRVDISACILRHFIKLQYYDLEMALDNQAEVLQYFLNASKNIASRRDRRSIRRAFLKAIIRCVTQSYLLKNYGYPYLNFSGYPSGDVYCHFYKTWEGTMANQVIATSEIDLQKWSQHIVRQFDRDLKKLMGTPKYLQSHRRQLVHDLTILSMARSTTTPILP